LAAKRLEFAVSLARTGEVSLEGGPALAVAEPWTPEHLLLAALARCTVASLVYHTGRRGLDATADASARGVVMKRGDDGRYAFVEIDCEVDVDLDPLSGEALGELLARAERDCFIAASLAVKPRYAWRVNGEPAAAAPT
jgi:organic hydroperoxide reductase OsmC/OhrA